MILTRKIAAALLMCAALWSPAQAGENLIVDITPVAPRAKDNPFTFTGIPVWTPIWVSRYDQGYPVIPTPDAACFSCFMAPFASNDGMRPAKSAFISFAVLGQTSNTRVRLVSFYFNYNTNQNVSDNTWCDQAPDQLNAPRIRVCDITTKWNAIWADPFLRAQQHQFYYEVIGTGSIYMARMLIDYAN